MKNIFSPPEEGAEFLGLKVPYLSTIDTFTYHANCIQSDIVFLFNLLASYNSALTQRHLNNVKHIFCYLYGTIDLSLFYPKESKSPLVGYADVRYLCDPHKEISQISYVFMCGDIAISLKPIKQIMIVTSSNHSEILSIHEVVNAYG